MQTRKRSATTTTIAKFMVPGIRRKETTTQRMRRLKKAKYKREEKKALQKLEEQSRIAAMRYQNDVDPLGIMEVKGQELQDYLVIKLEEETESDSIVTKTEESQDILTIKVERPDSPDYIYVVQTQSQSPEKQGFAPDVLKSQMVEIKREVVSESQDLLDELKGVPEPQECYYNQVFLPEIKLEPQNV